MKAVLFFSLLIILSQVMIAQINKEDLKEIISEARGKFHLPAVAGIVMSSKEILHSEVQGVKVYNTNNKVTIDNYFHIGSCSKSILANIAGKLIEDDMINWDTKFFEIIPELKTASKDEYKNITLENLFLCRAGIKAYTSSEEKFPQIDSTLENRRIEFAKWLLSQKPSSKVTKGKFEFLYSNASYTLASLMLEKVAGLSYEKLVEKYIIEELNIPTIIGFPNTHDKNETWGHKITKDSIESFSPDHEYKIPELLLPAGDLSMTPLGFAKFVQVQLEGLMNGNKFLTKDTFDKIHFSENGMSLGVANGEMAGLKFSGMDGSAGTFFCRAIIVPESDFAFAILTNTGSGISEMEAISWITSKIIKKQYNWWWKFWM